MEARRKHACNQQENQQTIREFLATRQWELRVGLDRQGQLGDRFAVEALPQVVVIGPDGTIQRVREGNYMGQNDGRITRISEDKIELI